MIGLFSIPVILMHLHEAGQGWLEKLKARAGLAAHGWGEAVAYAAMAWLILVNSGTPGEFIYFQF